MPDQPPSDDFMRALLNHTFAVDVEGTRMTQPALDAKNLRFYAEMFEQHQWSTVVIHWSVFAQTLREVAGRIEKLAERAA